MIRKLLQRSVIGFWVALMLLPFIAMLLPGRAAALSAKQKQVLSGGSLHFDVDTCSGDEDSRTGSIYVLGDSLTVDMKDEGLQQKLEEKGWKDVTIEATDGFNIADSLPKVTEDEAIISQADAVVIGLGTNRDSNFRAKLNELVTKINTYKPDVPIYWINIYTENPTYIAGGVAENNSINTILEEESGAEKISVIDWATEASTKASIYPFYDTVHHTPQGSTARAEFIANAVGAPSAGGAGDTGITEPVSGCECGASGTGTLTGADNEEKVFNYLSSGKGINGTQAAGIMGNMVAESNYNPTAQNPNGGAFGIVQWLGGRKDALQAAAAAAGVDLTQDNDANLQFQLDFMINESKARTMRDNSAVKEWDGLAQTTSVDGPKETGSTLFWEYNFERSEGTTNGPRVEAALAVVAKFGVQPGGSASGTASTTSGSISCPGSSEVCEGNAALPMPETTEIAWFNSSNHHQSISFPGGSDAHRPVLKKSNDFGITSISSSDSPLGEAADVGAPAGTTVYSPLDGTVKYSGAILSSDPSDKMVVIESSNEGKCVATLAHIQPTVAEGDTVTAGQEIGVLTTMSDSHLHFELWVDGVPINIGLDDDPRSLDSDGDNFADEAEQIWVKQKGALVGAGTAAEVQ